MYKFIYKLIGNMLLINKAIFHMWIFLKNQYQCLNCQAGIFLACAKRDFHVHYTCHIVPLWKTIFSTLLGDISICNKYIMLLTKCGLHELKLI